MTHKLKRAQTGSLDLDEENEKSTRALQKHQEGFTEVKETYIIASKELEEIDKDILETEKQLKQLQSDIEERNSWLGIPKKVQYQDVTANRSQVGVGRNLSHLCSKLGSC